MVKNSSGLLIVVLQQAAEPLPAPNPAFGASDPLVGEEQGVALALVISLAVIVDLVLLEGSAQGSFAEEDAVWLCTTLSAFLLVVEACD
jgi:hypothetical protein